MNSNIINILTRPLEREWSVQGLGMMRTYLSERDRLHIWHSSLAVDGATQLHDHPWNFSSQIWFGGIKQIRYADNDGASRDLYMNNTTTPHLVVNLDAKSETYMKQKILCGEGGCTMGEAEEIELSEGTLEIYYAGQTYPQLSHEIHKTMPFDNTVTIINRELQPLQPRDHAHVFIPKGAEFVSAEPRPATRAEILFITREVLHAYQEQS